MPRPTPIRIGDKFRMELDNEYGAICASGHPIFEGSDVAKSFTCTPATIALEHELELAFLDAEGFALASQQVENR